MSPTYTNSGRYLSGVRLVGEHRDIRTGPQASLQLCWLPVRPKRRQGLTQPRVLADLKCQHPETSLRTHLSGQVADVPDTVINSVIVDKLSRLGQTIQTE